MNTNLRPTLWAVFIALAMMIWLRWDYANAPQAPEPAPQTTAQSATASQDSDVPGQAANASAIPESNAGTAGQMIDVKTDVLDISINAVGGTIVESQLLKYTVSVDDKTPIQLFSSEPGKLFHLESGLNAPAQPSSPTHLATFSSAQTSYTLDGDKVSVPLTWQADGVTVTKTFTFYRGRYDFDIEQRVDNNSGKDWKGYQYQRLTRDRLDVKRGLGSFNTFAGGVYSTPESHYKKVGYDDLAIKGIDAKDVTGGWVAMMQHYFMGAIVPQQDNVDTFESSRLGANGPYAISVFGQSQSVASGSSTTFKTTGFVGPKIKDDLARIAPNLDKATDYGWLFFISDILFNILNWVHSVVMNWGWAIVIVTIGIKTILFPLAAKSFKSMAKMRKFQPEMERIRENYKEDRQLQGKKMMELYKKEGINPASGCLPILVQIPIFLAFYYMLMESVELRQAPWIFWIKDLALKDPFYVLPVINMGLMFLQQRLNPPPSDPIQRKVMMFMPLVFGIMFLVFPAGLVLYWTVSNSFSIIQQYVITKRYGGLAHPLSHAEDKHYHPKK